MNDNDAAIKTLTEGIIFAIETIIDNAHFNKGVTGRVVSSLGDNKYSVSINNKTYIAKSRHELEENEIVKLIKWNNKFSELYVIY